MKPKLLLTEAADTSSPAVVRLQSGFDVVAIDCNRSELLNRIGDFEYVWVKLRHLIDAEVFRSARRLRYLGTNTTGLTHIDLDSAAKHGVTILSLRGETEFLRDIRATAEHTVALLMALLRHMPAAVEHVRAGGWNRDLFRGRELYGKTAGIIGYGRLGRITARYLQAFDMQVIACGPQLTAADCEAGVTCVPLDELLTRSDVVSLHAAVTETNHQMLGTKEFALMRPGTWFINTARGELVDSAALLAALESGHLAGAAVDVLDHESSQGMSGHPLVSYARNHDNLLITPHLGGNTFESAERTELFLADKFLAARS